MITQASHKILRTHANNLILEEVSEDTSSLAQRSNKYFRQQDKKDKIEDESVLFDSAINNPPAGAVLKATATSLAISKSSKNISNHRDRDRDSTVQPTLQTMQQNKTLANLLKH